VTAYIVRRLLQSIIVLLGVSMLSFGLLFLSGDPAALMANEMWTATQLEEFRQQMGFDRPWYVQYYDFLSGAVRGDFGVSLRQRQPTFQLIMDRMPATLELAGASLLITVGVGVPLGVLAAIRRGSLWDSLLMLAALVGQSVPAFWLGLLLIMIFSVWLNWLPVAGRGGPQYLVLPAITLGLFATTYVARLARSSMLEVLSLDYVRTAYAKGLPRRSVIVRHALRNALLPLITIIGLQLGALLGGSVITETIFAWPGIGRLTYQAIQTKDLPLVQACVTVLAISFVLVNLLVDIAYTYLDPQVRLK
jgi:peptide/nickel transport system permease protein